MKAILSCTDNPLYDFFLPIAVHSWNKIGVECIVFVPENTSERFKIAQRYCSNTTEFHTLDIAPDREVTYFQVVRLLGCCLDLPEDEVLITSDVDMAVFGSYLKTYIANNVMIFGSDLTPASQYPMCYASATVKDWRRIMNTYGKAYQTVLGELLDDIQCENMRGNHWSKDQDLLKQNVDNGVVPIIHMTRAHKGTQFATRRCDRDGWNPMQRDLVDAHLPRPAYEENNFKKILELFQIQYPNDNFAWMTEYKNKYNEVNR